MSDEDEESNSIENDPIPAFGNLQVDDKNANCGAQGMTQFWFFFVFCFIKILQVEQLVEYIHQMLMLKSKERNLN